MRILFLVCCTWISVSVLAQTPLRSATQTMTYRIKASGGNNACGVTYNPKADIYYTFFAGNSAYPLESFDARGQNLYSSQIGIDTRSLWYSKEGLVGYAYPKKGKFSIALSKFGVPGTLKETQAKDEPNEIPNEQSAPALVKKNLYYFDGTYVYVLSSSLKEKKKFQLRSIPGDKSNLNSTSLIYTGVKGYELGFYDSFEGKLYFTDLKGNYTGTTLLPESAPAAATFKFAYANKMVWLYDANERIWHAYTVFN